MEGGFLLNVVIRQRATVLQLLARKDQALLIGRNAFLVLDLLFDVVNRVRGLDFQRNGLASKGFDEDLHDLDDCLYGSCENVSEKNVRAEFTKMC